MEDRVRKVLEQVASGALAVEDGLVELRRSPATAFVDTPNARVDTHRALRQGLPEVVFGLGKSPAQIAEIAAVLQEAGQSVLVTRVEADIAAELEQRVAGGVYDAMARLLWFGPSEVPVVGAGTIAVVSAGTSDAPVAEEAASVARRFGNEVDVLRDVGVAGIHRLLASEDALRTARVFCARRARTR